VIYFRWGPGDEDEELYLSSADWMGRNMFGRIELAWPVREPKVRQRVIDECLVPYLHDHCDAWTLDSQGVYHRDGCDGPGAQAALMAKYAPVS
jgi:polyphosphate kinase